MAAPVCGHSARSNWRGWMWRVPLAVGVPSGYIVLQVAGRAPRPTWRSIGDGRAASVSSPMALFSGGGADAVDHRRGGIHRSRPRGPSPHAAWVMFTTSWRCWRWAQAVRWLPAPRASRQVMAANWSPRRVQPAIDSTANQERTESNAIAAAEPVAASSSRSPAAVLSDGCAPTALGRWRWKIDARLRQIRPAPLRVAAASGSPRMLAAGRQGHFQVVRWIAPAPAGRHLRSPCPRLCSCAGRRMGCAGIAQQRHQALHHLPGCARRVVVHGHRRQPTPAASTPCIGVTAARCRCPAAQIPGRARWRRIPGFQALAAQGLAR